MLIIYRTSQIGTDLGLVVRMGDEDQNAGLKPIIEICGWGAWGNCDSPLARCTSSEVTILGFGVAAAGKANIHKQKEPVKISKMRD